MHNSSYRQIVEGILILAKYYEAENFIYAHDDYIFAPAYCRRGPVSDEDASKLNELDWTKFKGHADERDWDWEYYT